MDYMKGEDGYKRFFAYMNLFIAFMLTLVMADNLLVMYIGWEGVGLCSYLLIGFYYRDIKNNYAARKAFIVTRIGDTAMLIGLIMIFYVFGTMDIKEIMQRSSIEIGNTSYVATIISFLLLGGAVGKSAQLPLHVWLPDAMAGPSPVSALIHAATMVTAGVYLIARMNAIFILSPLAMNVVATIGALSLLIAGISALHQNDIKKVLAYSTISQIGYMFLALGVGAWSAGIFHFLIHAFFKALLFLGAGAIIISLHHEQNMFKMGGMAKKMPLVFFTFLIGSSSLAALPFITAGFYSKDSILWYAYSSEFGNIIFWLIAVVGAFITSLYTFKMVFITFFGSTKTKFDNKNTAKISIPLVILAIFSVIGGFIETPHNIGNIQLFSSFLNYCLPATNIKNDSYEIIFQLVAIILSLSGIVYAYYLYYRKDVYEGVLTRYQQFFRNGWNFDILYDKIFVQPFVSICQQIENDPIDKAIDKIAIIMKDVSQYVFKTQRGYISWALKGIVVGLIILILIVLIS